MCRGRVTFLSLHNHGSQTVRATDTNDNTDKTHKTIDTHKQASLEDRPSGTASRSTQPSQPVPVETALGPYRPLPTPRSAGPSSEADVAGADEAPEGREVVKVCPDALVGVEAVPAVTGGVGCVGRIAV